MNSPVCPETGAPMQRGVRPMTLEYKGARTTFDMPGWYCDASDESIHTGEDMKVSDRALNRLKAMTEGLPLPEEIKRIRTKIGLTQEAAGELIGGGPRAFQKYEAGDLLPSRAISSALACCSTTTQRDFPSFTRALTLTRQNIRPAGFTPAISRAPCRRAAWRIEREAIYDRGFCRTITEPPRRPSEKVSSFCPSPWIVHRSYMGVFFEAAANFSNNS